MEQLVTPWVPPASPPGLRYPVQAGCSVCKGDGVCPGIRGSQLWSCGQRFPECLLSMAQAGGMSVPRVSSRIRVKKTAPRVVLPTSRWSFPLPPVQWEGVARRPGEGGRWVDQGLTLCRRLGAPPSGAWRGHSGRRCCTGLGQSSCILS